ncbi:MAG: PAS domain S-box protein [Candidatus Moraniibacteriota bacterium]|nr:MAG: PAS domain S-box protein [Candidatus Moranbacteria bacterium]
MKKEISHIIFFSGLFTLIVVGFFINIYFEKSTEKTLREELTRLSEVVNLTVDSKKIASLEGNLEDEKNEEYLHLRKQFLLVGEALKKFDIRWIYFLRKEGESWIFLVDSIETESSDHAFPGEVYIDYPKEIDLVAKRYESLVAGPYTDPWGIFISSFIPVKDFETGESIGVLGLDIDADVWQEKITKAQIFPSVVIGTLILFWISFFLYRQKRSQNEKKISIRDLQLESVTKNIQDVVYRVNQEGIITYISPAVEAMFGFSPEEIEGKSIDFLLFPEIKKEEEERFWQSFQEKNDSLMNILLRHKNGEMREVEISGVFIQEKESIIEFQGIIHDVTKEKRINQKIEAQTENLKNSQKALLNVLEDIEIEKEKMEQEKDKLDAILYSIGDGVFVVDRHLKIVMVNNMVSTLTGYSNEELLLNEVYFERMKFISDDNEMKRDTFVEDVIQTGEEKKMMEHTALIQKNGNRMPVADSASPLKNKKGEVIGCVVVFRDATKEREINRMKSEFVSVASHQLRTPLTSIKWFAELLLDESNVNLTNEQKEYAKEIYEGNERLIDLVNDLLNVSRIETGKNFVVEMKKTDIVEIVRDVVKKQIPSAKEKNITIVLDEEIPEVLLLDIDGVKIEQVFQNLLSNAIKYSLENSEVRFGFLEEDRSVCFSVKDSGIGIPDDQKKHMFEKFFRASNVIMTEAQGTGLGLYIAKSIIEGHGGEIWFESSEKGTTFFIRLQK